MYSFLRSILALMGTDLDAPDHTTMSRRSRGLGAALRRVVPDGPTHLIVDSTRLTIMGEGEWAAAKHGVRARCGWRKLHLGVDASGVLVAQVLTDGRADDAATVPELLEQVEGQLAAFTADTAYDARAVYAAASARGAGW